MPKVSPISAKVDSMSDRELFDEMSDLAGEIRAWTESVDALLSYCEEHNLLGYPRYFYKSRQGSWIIKEFLTGQVIAADPSLPIALCRAILIITRGKGVSYCESLR